jgi:hypothetical protein
MVGQGRWRNGRSAARVGLYVTVRYFKWRAVTVGTGATEAIRKGHGVNQHDHGEVVAGPNLPSRRDVIVRGAALGAMVWAAPAVTRLAAVSAQGTPECVEDPSGERVFSTPGSYTFQVPLGVASITVEVWGAGGDGAAGGGNVGGKGGGGGGYAMRSYEVTECEFFDLTVGAGGGGTTTGVSSFTGPEEVGVTAAAGDNGTSQNAGGTGGTAAGDVAVNGGTGGNGSTGAGASEGSGGGGGASPPDGTVAGRDGANAATNAGGAGGAGTGGGGAGGTRNQPGAPGTAPGGGGGGGGGSSVGGTGAHGRVRVTWEV